MVTAIMDILETPKGKEILGPVIKGMSDAQAEGAGDDSLGEGGEEMFDSMVMEMPIVTLASFGMMSMEQVQELIDKLNS
jgi:beta-glucosidase